ncbi:Glycosyl hydrolase family 1 [Nannocystis exedens]|uniref:Glycosyl hydrolase family 1 n=1 Tax=Nannocystis exedens TaxID=54 RepID=A0A1I2H539_9BACT|nr:glycoside hydrolase [Nannocystis exedens]PCC74019.1 dTDP-4-dehydrorhamnose reductase [Nannocystis exedens]SFF24503.1 Glycosyl hydrolase family 1 [Nannocystis exedens]
MLSAWGLTPIVGLLHHGSGPPHTHLLDPDFPRLLARFARAVARRYPWVEYYTPVNEPLTTARFSGLYGHWYPHHRNDASFCRALVNQCLATQWAMREIRRVNPRARLVHTEDLGATLATPALLYQAEFENERRFLSHDLLCGRVDRGHPLYTYLRAFGIDDGELALLRDLPPPDLLGANHYITSVRFLDDRLEHYPHIIAGGNGRHRYVDVEAVRVCDDGMLWPYELLHELGARYRLPIAVTEAHLACDVDEQIRWFDELWRAAERCRAAGIDVRAVTAWSLFGAYDWHCLVTRETGQYEPGAFDVRDGTPRPTELARYLAGLAAGPAGDHPALGAPGWWRLPSRLHYPPPWARRHPSGPCFQHPGAAAPRGA